MPKQARSMKLPRLVTGIAAFDQFVETWAQAIEGLYNVTYGPQFDVVDSPTGRVVAMKRPSRFVAQITGTNGDGSYSWAEVYGSASGGWTTLPDGRTGSLATDKAWEVNKSFVSKNSYVEIEFNNDSGEWRFVTGVGGLQKAKNGASSVGPGATGSANYKADGSGDAFTVSNPYASSTIPANAFMWVCGTEAVSWDC